MAPLVALTGFMGSGKSSVGARAAELLGWAFIDLDGQIVKAEGMPIAQYFARYGEANFRRREVRALRSLLAELDSQGKGKRGVVLALGGGTLLSPEAAALLAERGGIVYLDVDLDKAWDRACGEDRPLAQDPEDFQRLWVGRRPVYERAADWILPVAQHGVEDLAQEIAQLVTAAGPRWPSSWGLQLASTERPSLVVGGAGCLAGLRIHGESAVKCGARFFLVTDTNVDGAWTEAVREALGPAGQRAERLALPPGERSKTVHNLETCWEWLAVHGARRDDIVLALGGGVVGDLAGFAAATYQRGVGLWQVPTSLLAQVDSSVGGKTAIDLQAGKNLAGAFYQPQLVVVDPEILSTLPQREFINGLAEVAKYGLLAGEDLLGRLERQRRSLCERETDRLSDIIKTCVRYKAAVVAEDERDTAKRAVLNLGHTTAHALEVTLGYGRLGHGEAVGLGLLVALKVSEELLGLDGEVLPRTRALLSALGLPIAVELPPVDLLLAAAAKDKKAAAESAGFVGLRAIGAPVWKLALPDGLLAEALETIRT